MKKNVHEQEIFSSWKNCALSKLSPDSLPARTLDDAQLKNLLETYRPIIAALESSMTLIENLIPARTAFLLTDTQGTLLKKIPETSLFPILQEGSSLEEQCSGTNAISLSLQLRQPILTFPEHHYCTFLNDNHLYALPFPMGIQPICLALITKHKPILRESMALLHILAHDMKHKWHMIKQQQRIHNNAALRLTKKQRAILLCLARGMSDKAAALQLHICFDTIRYHKRNLYRLLNVDCGISAVTEALRKGIITIEELENCPKVSALNHSFE